MIVKRLQLSEAFGKIMKDVESMESNLESVALPQDNPQQLFHSQQDLENHIQTLKVRAKLYIPSTLNIDLILWHTQSIVCAIEC